MDRLSYLHVSFFFFLLFKPFRSLSELKRYEIATLKIYNFVNESLYSIDFFEETFLPSIKHLDNVHGRSDTFLFEEEEIHGSVE